LATSLLDKSTVDFNATLISDEQAKTNVLENKKWMFGGYIHESDKKAVEQAFQIVHDDIDISEGANGEVEDMVTGPAVQWALLGNIMTWSTFVVVTLVSTYLVEVDNAGIALKPKGIYLGLGIMVWLAFTLLSLIPEYKAMMYCLPSQSVCVARIAEGPKKWWGLNRWMISMFVISIILHADIYTTAIFMGRIWASTSQCGTLNELWRLAVHHSFLKNVPIINILTYAQLCCAAWCLMVSQFVYALFYSIPISPNVAKGMDVSIKRIQYDLAPDKAHIQKYDTILKKNTGHGRCLQALSESGRMCSLNWQDDAYLEQAERDWDCFRVHDEMRRTNLRFLLFCIQATFIPNLQITFLGIQKSQRVQLGHAAPDYLTILSFTISVLNGLHYIYYEFGSVNRHKKYVRHAINEAKQHAKETKHGRKHWEAHLLETKVKFSLFLNSIFTLVFSGMFCFILLKASMEVVFCESGIWNVDFNTTSWSLMDGCLDKNEVPWTNYTLGCKPAGIDAASWLNGSSGN